MFKMDWLLRLGLAAVVLAAAGGVRAERPAAGDLLGGSGLNFSSGEEGDLQVSASVAKAERGQPAQLVITAEIPEGWHTFSVTQPAGGPLKTKIKLDASKDFKVAGDFRADPAPKVGKSAAYGDLPIETHEGHVTWKAPIELAAGVDPAALTIKGAVSAQRCLGDDKCLPPKSFKFTATIEEGTNKEQPPPAGASERGSRPPPIPDATPDAPRTAASGGTSGQFAPVAAHLVLRGWIEPAIAAPGTNATLVLTAQPTDGYHVYAFADHDPLAIGLGKPTLIRLTETSGLRYGAAQPSERPLEKPAGAGLDGTIRYHEAPIRWTIPIEVPSSAKSGNYGIGGVIGFHTCNDAIGCDLPKGAEFSATLIVGAAAARSTVEPLQFRPAEYATVARLAVQAAGNDALSKPNPAAHAPIASKEEPVTLAAVILLSLLGGFILNFMPCVLPVIGLKLLSFLEQGGKSRTHVFALNICYTLGLLAVFMVLATLTAFAGFAWGERSTSFNIGLTCVVFVMALSFLGVWEIPIPGFVGSGKGVELAAREGAIGAFAKGILTTVLATPCSGPFLGLVFAFCAKQPPGTVYLVFGLIGVGMALPYLVIGLFPRLIRFLPKPGAWMDTFKQFMGFVLLGTVVYLFWTLNRTYLVPTFALLIGLWAGCWWIGRTPLFAPLSRKLATWAVGGAVAAVVGVFAFLFLTPALLKGEPYSQSRLEKLAAEGKTVLLDFTANWCPTCQVNTRFVINSEEIQNAIKTSGAVLMVADWSDYGPEIKAALTNLTASESIPVLVIFPAGRADDPIILRDLLTTSDLMKAIQQAGQPKTEVQAVDAAPLGPKPEQKAPGMAALR
jgi:suppressor for copper-sensitivity B